MIGQRSVKRSIEYRHLRHAGAERVAREARESCMNEGFRVETSGFRDCVGREIDARSDLLVLGDDQSGENVAASQ